MTRRFEFDDAGEFLRKLRELQESGISNEIIGIRMPYHIPEAETLLSTRPSRLRFFALAGGLFGFGGGFALTIYSVLSWPIIVGGKPIISIPPFLLIAYLLVILFGSLGSFAGFLLLARLPNVDPLLDDEEFQGNFIISVKEGEEP